MNQIYSTLATIGFCALAIGCLIIYKSKRFKKFLLGHALTPEEMEKYLFEQDKDRNRMIRAGATESEIAKFDKELRLNIYRRLLKLEYHNELWKTAFVGTIIITFVVQKWMELSSHS